jgi:hypothetical protein
MTGKIEGNDPFFGSHSVHDVLWTRVVLKDTSLPPFCNGDATGGATRCIRRPLTRSVSFEKEEGKMPGEDFSSRTS